MLTDRTLVMQKRTNIRPLVVVALLMSTPSFVWADFCDTLAKSTAESCRVNARSMGATIHGNWLRLKPEIASQSSTGAKGRFVSGTTPAVGTLGVPHQGKLKLTIDCFAGKRSMRIDALPYMLGLSNGGNKKFDLRLKIDNRPPFSETWALDWQRAELKAPGGSRLANELQRSDKLVVTTEGIVGRNSPVGYVYNTSGFDEMSAGLCK